MLAFDLSAEQMFNAERHVEKILGVVGEGDVTVACWDPGQTSPNHLHPNATEIYFCVQGGGSVLAAFDAGGRLSFAATTAPQHRRLSIGRGSTAMTLGFITSRHRPIPSRSRKGSMAMIFSRAAISPRITQ